MGKRMTIKKIAELAGVSNATVSKVLNNNGRFSEDTRKKVLEIVKKYDYRPNAVAKSLRTQRSKTIGLIVPDITNEFFAKLVLAIENYCNPKGYSLFICNTDENEEKELQYFQELELKGVDGLIYLSGSDQLLQSGSKMPIVCIDRKPKSRHVTIVTSDNYWGGYLAGDELIRKGCKNPLLIRDYRDVFSTVERSTGFEEVLRKNGTILSENNILTVEVGVDHSYRAINEVLDTGEFPYDGIFGTTDSLALGAFLALQEFGIKVPGQVKIIGYDNVSIAKYTNLSSINQQSNLMGERAAEELIQMIDSGLVHKQQVITVPVQLVARGSTKGTQN